ncbi:MAG: MlaE family ABC transporter permease [Haloechinothrix sp.]
MTNQLNERRQDDRAELTDRTLEIIARPGAILEGFGEQMSFYFRALAWAPRTIRRYRKETLRILTEVCFGTGALAVIGGTLGVMIGMTMFTGLIVGLQGYSSLDQLGTAALTGFISAYFNTREVAPLSAGLALSATVGCGFTAQLGAMRISEEIDALETMAVPSLPFLVTTRVLAGVAAVVPLYAVGLLSSYLASRQITIWVYGQSAGTYDHYFTIFLPPEDVVWSFLKVMMFALVVIMSHCYYGYNARGGPAGVGLAVGKAVRTSIVMIAVLDFFLSLAIWGSTTTVRIAG